MKKFSLQNGSTDGGPSKSNSDRIALAAVLIIVCLGIIVIILSAEATSVFSKSLDPWYCFSTSTTSLHVLNNQAVARAVYDDQVFFDFDQNFSTLAFNVTAVRQNDSAMDLGPLTFWTHSATKITGIRSGSLGTGL